jgi:hypothetical protein
MLILRRRSILIAKNTLLFGLILLANCIDATEETKKTKEIKKTFDKSASKLLLNTYASLKFKDVENKSGINLLPPQIENKSQINLLKQQTENKSQINLLKQQTENKLQINFLKQQTEKPIETPIRENLSLKEELMLLDEFNLRKYRKHKGRIADNNENRSYDKALFLRVMPIEEIVIKEKLNEKLPDGTPVLYQIIKNSKNDFKFFAPLINKFFNENQGLNSKNNKGKTSIYPLLNSFFSSKASKEAKIIQFYNDAITFYYMPENNDCGSCEKYTFPIKNVSEILNMKNNRDETPLNYIFNKFHPMAIKNVTKRLMKLMKKYNYYYDNDLDFRSLPNTMSRLYHIIREVHFSSKNEVETTFEDPICKPVLGIIPGRDMYEIDKSLLPLRERIRIINPLVWYPLLKPNSDYIYLDDYLSQYGLTNELINIKNYVALKNDIKIYNNTYKRYLSFLLSMKRNKYILPTPLKKMIFSLLLEGHEKNDNLLLVETSLESIITKIENNIFLTEDDLKDLQSAARKF